MPMDFPTTLEMAEFSKIGAPLHRQFCQELTGRRPHYRLLADYERGRFRRKAGETMCRPHQQTKMQPTPDSREICPRCVHIVAREVKYLHAGHKGSTRSGINQE